MQAVYEQYLVLGEFELVDIESATACLEVVVRCLDGLAGHELAEVAIEQLEVQRMWRFVVVVAELIAWMFLELEEVVVDINGFQSDAMFLEPGPHLDSRSCFP